MKIDGRAWAEIGRDLGLLTEAEIGKIRKEARKSFPEASIEAFAAAEAATRAAYAVAALKFIYGSS